jgi:hypothetical protein
MAPWNFTVRAGDGSAREVVFYAHGAAEARRMATAWAKRTGHSLAPGAYGPRRGARLSEAGPLTLDEEDA